MSLVEVFEKFLKSPPEDAGPIYNERSLQLEIGLLLRREGFEVQFERPFQAERPAGSTKPPKTNLDLFVTAGKLQHAIELKVPLNKRHPETLYDFCADLEFVEALVRIGKVQSGLCLLVTNDSVFWEDSGRGSMIHDYFRRPGEILTGKVQKPTGARDTSVVLTGRYMPSAKWSRLTSSRLMEEARYLLMEVLP